jgi:hypothetical protein
VKTVADASELDNHPHSISSADASEELTLAIPRGVECSCLNFE